MTWSSNPVAKLVEQVNAGVYNDSELQVALEYFPITNIMPLLPIMASVEKCDSCKKYCFSKNTIPTYGRLGYVCARCRKFWYMECTECKSAILKDDTVMHVHANQLLDFMEYNELLHHKTNPLDTPGGTFLRHPSQVDSSHLRFFGVEVELEKNRNRPLPPDLIAKSIRVFPDGAMTGKTDGSLSKDPSYPDKNGSNGWELASMPATLEWHRSVESGWPKFFEAISPFVQQRPDTTGLHFHVNLESVTPLVVGKVSAWINAACNRTLLMTVADRDYNQPSPTPPHKKFCKTSGTIGERSAIGQLKQVHSMRKHTSHCPFNIMNRATRMYYYDPSMGFRFDNAGHPIIIRIDNDPLLRYLCHCENGDYEYKDHYAALNLLTHKGTFEFRMFRFSMNMAHFYASLEFVDAIIDFCAQASIHELDTPAFVRWYERSRRRLYPSLTQWLVDHGFLVSRRRKD